MRSLYRGVRSPVVQCIRRGQGLPSVPSSRRKPPPDHVHHSLWTLQLSQSSIRRLQHQRALQPPHGRVLPRHEQHPTSGGRRHRLQQDERGAHHPCEGVPEPLQSPRRVAEPGKNATHEKQRQVRRVHRLVRGLQARSSADRGDRGVPGPTVTYRPAELFRTGKSNGIVQRGDSRAARATAPSAQFQTQLYVG